MIAEDKFPLSPRLKPHQAIAGVDGCAATGTMLLPKVDYPLAVILWPRQTTSLLQ